MLSQDEGVARHSPPAAGPFPDVPTDFWAYKCVEYYKSKSTVNGYSDGTYQPRIVVTRDQMAVYVARAFGLPM